MEEPLTEDLLKQLLATSNPDEFVQQQSGKTRTLSMYLQELLDKKSLNRADVIREANLNETFGYQIFMGQRNASRNKVLQLAFAMHLDIRETDRLLQSAGVNALYCKDRRDAIIIFAINKGYSLQKTDEELYRFKEETICS